MSRRVLLCLRSPVHSGVSSERRSGAVPAFPRLPFLQRPHLPAGEGAGAGRLCESGLPGHEVLSIPSWECG